MISVHLRPFAVALGCRHPMGVPIILRLPVLQLETGDAAELSRVMRHQCEVVLHSNRRDLQVMRADSRASLFQVVPQPGASLRTLIIKWQRCEWGEKHIQLSVFTDRIGTALRTVAEFIDDYGAQNDIAQSCRLPPCQQTRIALTQKPDARVRVREIDHPSGRRSSYSPCGARSSSGIEPAIRSKNPLGQPFASTSPFGDADLTWTVTSTSALLTPTSRLRWSFPSGVVCARASIVSFSIP